MGQALVTIIESRNDSSACPMHPQQGINMDRRRLEMTVLMTPDMANYSGNALLNHLDRVAFSQASRYSGRYTVTLSVDQVTFKEPIHVGDDVSSERESCRPNFDGDRHSRLAISRWWPSRLRCQTYTIETTTDARRSRAAELRRKIRREIAVELERAAEGVE